MADEGNAAMDTNALLQEILSSLKSLKQDHSQLASSVDAINGRVNTLAGIKQVQDGIAHDATLPSPRIAPRTHQSRESVGSLEDHSKDAAEPSHSTSPPPERRPSTTSKIILTSYPGQAGVDPIPLKWGRSRIFKYVSIFR